MLTVLTMDEVNRDEQADMYTTTFKAALADRMKDFKGGEYALFFQNCEEMLLVTFDLRVSLYNVGKSGNKDYLPVGEDVLPTLYMVWPLISLTRAATAQISDAAGTLSRRFLWLYLGNKLQASNSQLTSSHLSAMSCIFML